MVPSQHDSTETASGRVASGRPVSRRALLKRGAVTAGAVTAGTVPAAAATADPAATGPFEERPWGYVREGFEPPNGRRAAVLEMDGYGEAEPATHYVRMRDGTLIAVRMGYTRSPIELDSSDFVTAQASIRGTGCSGGTFDLLARRNHRDGHELVEWLAARPWTHNGVGLYGKSFSGFTAFLIATTQPPSLAAAMPTKIFADLYRGINYPGGVRNYLLNAAWAYGVQPARDTRGTAEGLAAADPICAHNTATREPRGPNEEPAIWANPVTADTWGHQWRIRSTITYADRLAVPTYISHAWQDEQTGPRGGPEIFRVIDPDPVAGADEVPGSGPPDGVPGLSTGQAPKLFRATNGYHSTADTLSFADVSDWFRYWLLGERTGIMDGPPIELHVNTGVPDSHATVGLASFYTNARTDWERFHLGADGRLTPTAPEEAGVDRYVTGSPRQSWVYVPGLGGDEVGDEVTWADGPDLLTYRSDPVDDPTLIAGPITATMYVESTAPNMDLFVTVADQYPDGNIHPIQRGMLRASHRRLLEDRTLYNAAGEIIRPYRPHTNPTPIEPATVYRFDVEVFPVGHLMHAGHRLLVGVHSPPLSDGLWGYVPTETQGVNTVHRAPDRPSSIHVPMGAWPGPAPPEPPCGGPTGYRCVSPAF